LIAGFVDVFKQVNNFVQVVENISINVCYYQDYCHLCYLLCVRVCVCGGVCMCVRVIEFNQYQRQEQNIFYTFGVLDCSFILIRL